MCLFVSQSLLSVSICLSVSLSSFSSAVTITTTTTTTVASAAAATPAATTTIPPPPPPLLLLTKDFILQLQPPEFHGLPKIHKDKHDTHLGPLFSEGVVTYGVAKELASILSPLVGHFPSISETPNTLWYTSKPSSYKKGNAFLPLM